MEQAVKIIAVNGSGGLRDYQILVNFGSEMTFLDRTAPVLDRPMNWRKVSPAMDGNNPQALEYAPRPSRSSRVKRLIIAWMCILIVGGLAWRHGPYGWWYLQVLYWQNQCLNYSFPPGQQIIPGSSVFIPRPWDQLYSILYTPTVPTDGTLFLHERRSPSGNIRLVVLDTRLFFDGTDDSIQPVARIFRAGSVLRIVDELPTPVISANALAKTDKLFAGQIDLANPSHFTIGAVLNGQETIIDGWLEDDDRVLLEPRLTAATRPTTQSVH
ncbi:MAG TPA: hypothetical protein VHD56_14530 [Tepidisphaeraceae bacterium]|nr:hypothetical protein [Tepidisphaeraceae bacterium]